MMSQKAILVKSQGECRPRIKFNLASMCALDQEPPVSSQDEALLRPASATADEICEQDVHNFDAALLDPQELLLSQRGSLEQRDDVPMSGRPALF